MEKSSGKRDERVLNVTCDYSSSITVLLSLCGSTVQPGSGCDSKNHDKGTDASGAKPPCKNASQEASVCNKSPSLQVKHAHSLRCTGGGARRCKEGVQVVQAQGGTGILHLLQRSQDHPTIQRVRGIAKGPRDRQQPKKVSTCQRKYRPEVMGYGLWVTRLSG